MVRDEPFEPFHALCVVRVCAQSARAAITAVTRTGGKLVSSLSYEVQGLDAPFPVRRSQQCELLLGVQIEDGEIALVNLLLAEGVAGVDAEALVRDPRIIEVVIAATVALARTGELTVRPPELPMALHIDR